MKKIVSVLLALVMLFTAQITCSAADNGQTYYVDSVNGDDANSGLSPSAAWKTIEKASSITYSAGDSILLKSGSIFNGSFTARGSATADRPITLGSYGNDGGLPIIRNDRDVALVRIQNVSGWVIENLELTAPDGHGIHIVANNGFNTENITVKNCVLHDISNKALTTRYPVMLASEGAKSRLNNITLKDLDIYDCGYGIAMSGLSREWTPELFTTEEESYNHNYLIEGVSINNLLYDGIIIMSVYGMVIRNCSLINTCLLDDHYTAPMWSHHASHFLIENCEIAGAKNELDGMAVDFDGWTTDSTYQYIYSHDNVRFIRNCCYDNYTANRNCTVRYCLSVNDNKGDNSLAQLLSSGSLNYAEDEYAVSMDNFKFYNNTLINMSELSLIGLKNAYVANNIFTGDMTSAFRFARKSYDANDNKVIYEFDGTMENNCFYGTPVPYIAKNNYTCNPSFTGSNEADKNSFMLSAASTLLGKGMKVEDDMGEFDFFGNRLTDSINIGCYGGSGESTFASLDFLKSIKAFFDTVFGAIYNFIYSCNDRYWIF